MIRRTGRIGLSFLMFLIASIGFCLSAQALDYKHPKRPKIGLVLGGGGARGAAHVGVLKVLEANKVPIDYIVGTSMGSIVGGLYASGYSPGEIQALLSEIDWLDIFSDRPKENMLSFRDKQNLKRLASFELGIKNGKILFPKGIISGQKLGFMLQKLTTHTIEVEHFDDLRIPFRAVATDAETGEMVVFKEGNLAEAIRASMSVPGAFPPVEIGERVFIDGFLAKNVPVEVAKEMGADIIIAVSVDPGLLKKEQLNTLLDVTNQMILILSQQNVKQSLSLLTDKDILIRPELGDMRSVDFTDSAEAIKHGEEAALGFVKDFQRYALTEKEYQLYLANQRVREDKPFVIDFVKVKQPQRVNEQMIKGRIKTKAGEPLDFDQLQKDLTNVYAIGDFETVGFKLEEQAGEKGLVIDTKEKSWGPNYLRFGLNLVSDSDGENSYNLILDYRRTQMNNLGAEWKVVAQVGQIQGLFNEFYQPLDPENYFFVAPHAGYQRSLTDVYEDEHNIAEYKVDEFKGGIDLGVNLRSYLEARFGIMTSVIDASPEVGGTTLPEFSSINRSGYLAQFDFDQLDDHKFPTRGARGFGKFFISDESLGADQSYEKLDLLFMKATTLGEKHTFITLASGGLSLDDKTPFYDEYNLGGFLSLSGLSKDQLRGRNVGVGELIYFYKLAQMQGFASKIYIGGSFETGGVWESKGDFGKDLISGGSVFFGVDTILGPLYIAYGQAEGNDGKGYLFLGQTF